MPRALYDAWSTLVPSSGDRHGPLPPLLVGFTVLTGVLDAFSYLVLGRVFVANMTGNVVFIAFSLAGAKGFSLLASLLALGAFSAGSLCAARSTHRFAQHRGQLLLASTTLEAAFVIAALIASEVARHPFVGTAHDLLIVLLAMAMGTQNATARRLAVPDLTTTVLTLTLTGISADSKLAGGTDSKIGRRLVSVGAMFLGALFGSLIALKTAPALDLVLGGSILVVIGAAGLSLRHSTQPFVVPV